MSRKAGYVLPENWDRGINTYILLTMPASITVTINSGSSESTTFGSAAVSICWAVSACGCI